MEKNKDLRQPDEIAQDPGKTVKQESVQPAGQPNTGENVETGQQDGNYVPGIEGQGDNETEKNKESVEKPETAKEKAKVTVDEFARKLAEKSKEQQEFIDPYIKAYPKERVFHVTSDRQVFLERDRSLAVLHQNTLGNEGKVQTIKVK